MHTYYIYIHICICINDCRDGAQATGKTELPFAEVGKSWKEQVWREEED
jgi:hypothetical protein